MDEVKLSLVAGVGIRLKCSDTKTTSYQYWCNMINRCYSQSVIKRRKTYQNCSVCCEWLTYENFKPWFEGNYKTGYELDKDILQNGKEFKIYSPDTCIFIPKELNGFLTATRSNKGIYPTGVSLYKGKYKAQIRKEGKQYCIGVFDTITEAENAYISAKSEHLQYLLNKYNFTLP